MRKPHVCAVGSERGVALIIVLLLLAVMSGLATGLTLNSQVEIAMATNETYYAGARAAAEAGINRAKAAIIANSTTNLLKGVNNAADPLNPGAAVNADNGRIDFMLTGGPTYAIGTTGQYSYTLRIFDDDDASLYPGLPGGVLSAPQLLAMGGGLIPEDGNKNNDTNDRLVLLATGFGPAGTTVRIMRIVSSVDFLNPPPALPPPTPSDPAIVVDGSLVISGNPTVNGNNGSVHANGNLAVNGNSTFVEKKATASGNFSANTNWTAGVSQGGHEPKVTVPTVNAADYRFLATHILQTNGQVILVSTGAVVTTTGWTMSGGIWRLGHTGEPGTFYVEGGGGARIEGNPGSAKTPLALSVISEGSIEVAGNPTLTPQNANKLQFVTNGDLKLAGNLDIDPTTVEGQSFVRNQLMISGNPDIRGRIIVKDLPTVSPVANIVDSSVISGSPEISYNGSFEDLVVPPPPAPPPTTSYNNSILGWIES